MQDITRKNFEAELVNASLDQPVLLDIWAAVVRPVQVARAGAREARDRLRRPLQAGQARRRRRARDRAAALADVRRAQHPVLRALAWAASRSTASSAPCPRARSASSSTSTCRAPRSRPPRKQLQEAEELLAEGDSEAAIDRLQAALATNPANDAARYDYLRALLAAGRVAEARKAFDPVANAVVPDAAPGRRRPLARGDGSGADGPPRRGTARRGDRRQQARLRRPLRAGASALRQQRVHRGRWTSCSRS